MKAILVNDDRSLRAGHNIGMGGRIAEGVGNGFDFCRQVHHVIGDGAVKIKFPKRIGVKNGFSMVFIHIKSEVIFTSLL